MSGQPPSVAKKLEFIATMIDGCALAVGDHSRELSGRMHVGTHLFRMGFDHLLEARALMEAAARLEASQ